MQSKLLRNLLNIAYKFPQPKEHTTMQRNAGIFRCCQENSVTQPTQDWLSSLQRKEKIELVSVCLRRAATTLALRCITEFSWHQRKIRLRCVALLIAENRA